MLVFTRRPLEEVMIGQDIVITLLQIKGGQIRIGIQAPRHIPVHRKEIYERLVAEHRTQLTLKPRASTTSEAVSASKIAKCQFSSQTRR